MRARRIIKGIVPRSLLGRSILIIVAPLVLLQIIATAIFWENHWDRITGRLIDDFVGEIAAVVDLMRAMPGKGNRDLILSTGERMGLHLVVEPGAILPNEPPRRPGGFIERKLIRTLTSVIRRPLQVDMDAGDKQIAVAVQLSDGVLRVLATRKRVDSSSALVFTIWMVGSAMLLFGIAMIFMRNQVRSVHRLAAAADEFGKGRDIPDFKPEGASEVRQAAMAFNLMRERIRRQIAQRTEMLAGVSHDLRTPLTRMKLQVAMMGAAEGLAELQQDIGEMERMIEGYLAFARGEGDERMQFTDLVALIEDVIGRFRRNGTDVELDTAEELQLLLRPHAFDRCLSNLLSNAGRYGRRVRIGAHRRGDWVEVTVEDDGPGIPRDRREDVFKAFYRLDSSRNQATGGVGLGMTIARDVVRGHGGEILLDDSSLGGLMVRLRLPV